MNKPKIFIGSSSEGLPIAKALFSLLAENFQPKLWNHFIFGTSQYTMESLENQIETSDFAVLVATIDDEVISREASYKSMRDNVLFELGLFAGGLGRKRTFLVIPTSNSLKIPSDLFGISHATYDPSLTSKNIEDNVSALQVASLQIEQAIRKEKEKRIVRADYEKEFSNRLLELFKTALDFDDYAAITDLGLTVSEFLWQRGFYSTLEQVGLHLEDAASKERKIEIQLEALIEYLGWMKTSKGDVKTGKKYLEDGLSLAKQHDQLVWICRANRHLAAIDFIDKNYTSAIKKLESAESVAIQINAEEAVDAQLASTYYGFSEIYIAIQDSSKAIEYNSKSHHYYQKIEQNKSSIKLRASSSIKLRAQKGKILELSDDFIRAKNEYNEGLELAKLHKRNDELIRNYWGLSRINEKLGNMEESKRNKEKAIELEKITPLAFR